MTMTRIKRILLTIMVALGLIVPLTNLALVSAQVDIPGSLCVGGQLKIDGECPDPGETSDAINKLITNIINILSFIVGIIAVIMIIIGGIKYITSGGDSGSVTGAKNTVLYAVIGLVIVALAQVMGHRLDLYSTST
jgi:hypothetical protein